MRLALPLALAALLAVAACDNAPGPRDPVGTPPALSGFAAAPLEVFLDSPAPFAEVPLALSADVRGGEGVVTVRYLVRYQGTDTLVAQGTQPAAAGRTTIDVPLRLPRGAIGDYAITVTTEDAAGRVGDRAAATLRFGATSLGPPVVSQVTVPPRTARPATGQTTLRIIATVDDPDGRANIARVDLRAPGAGNVLAQLSDDGRTAGDQTARDGRYTVALSVTPTTAAGPYAFEVVARDRAGLASAPAAVTFVIE
ncbi:MAG: hypothetical protein ACK41D_09625 [Rubricoccaceae bacterium]